MNDKEKTISRYREENKSCLKHQIVFTGSSLMEMFPINKLLAEHGDDTIIYNRGVSGFTTDELFPVIDVCAIDLMPAKLFINIGTNDLSSQSIPIATVIDKYEKIISKVESNVPDVSIYLMAYYPVNPDAAADFMKECLKIRTNSKITAANIEVNKLANRHCQHYIDVNARLKDSLGRLKAEYTIEGMHINESGYRAIYDDLMRYVKE